MQDAQIGGGKLHLGVSSWLYEEWRGVFYPDKLPNKEMLSFYAGQFDSVEVNTSFYGLPSPSTVLTWVENVPTAFTFSLKFPRSVSHEARLVDVAQESLAFLDVLRSLGPAAGVGFLQLPPSFTRRTDGRALADYVDWLATQLAMPGGEDLRVAVEVRSPDLMTPAFARFLAERGMALALVDRVNQPDLFPLWLELVTEGVAPDFTFIRWIGDDGDPPPDRVQMHRPQDEKLDLWAERLADLLALDQQVYAYMHNPYEGHSPSPSAACKNGWPRASACAPGPRKIFSHRLRRYFVRTSKLAETKNIREIVDFPDVPLGSFLLNIVLSRLAHWDCPWLRASAG